MRQPSSSDLPTITKATAPTSSGADERRALMDRAQGPRQKPTEALEEQGLRTVRDPITGASVDIEDSTPPRNYGSTENILYKPFPAPVEAELRPITRIINRLIIGVPVVSLALLLSAGVTVLHAALIGTCALGATWALGAVRHRIPREMDRVRAAMVHERAASIQPPAPESAEWVNALLTSFWPLIDPGLFVSIIDMIEDVMQQSLPSFVEAVRVSDFSLGTNPLRLLSMRALANESMDPKMDGHSSMKQVAEYVNYEIQFQYSAEQGRSQKTKSHNIHLMLEFFIGMLDWIRIPLKIWAQVESVSGTARVRLQLIPEFPYVGEVTYTLLGIPQLDVSIYPLSRRMPNVLDIPMLSGFIRQSIAAGMSAYVAPASGVINIASILAPTQIGDCNALGVFVIVIHWARDLEDRDGNGKSDPYIVLAYAKAGFGKPLYSTRIIAEELNPSFEETTVLMLTQNELDAEEDLSAMLWDSDKRTADDLLGRVKIPVRELVKKPNVMHKREDPLIGFEDADEMKGTLCWSVGYFEKLPLNKALERPKPDEQQQQQSRPPPPDANGCQDAARNPPPPSEQPADVLRTPPDPAWPSGVLHVTVHQIFGLEHQELRGNMGKDNREERTGQDTDQPEEEGDSLPSSYCEFVVNDDLVYKTRVKQYTSMPFFEAGTEVFVRDWTKAQVRIVVRDALLRERDPVLGIISLNVKDVLSGSSEATGLYALEEGVGFGRANVSILFKSVNLKLPRPLLGWDTATVEVLPSPITLNITTPKKEKFKKLLLSTSDSTEKLTKPSGPNTWTIDAPVRLPVYARYASAFFVELRDGGFELLDRGPDAVALLWLKDLEDDKEVEMDLPVWTADKLEILKQNVITDAYREKHKCEQIGTLRVKLRLDPGLDLDHEKTAHSQARKHAFETYDHAEGQAQVAEINSHANDDGVIDKDERKSINKAEKKQLQNRQRGANGYKPVRTVRWVAHGMKLRIKPERQAKREPAVRTEEAA
ncbi:hypothetical protein AURDEDRAFT_183631 [Auricularia subglabra TFB-10046 SS5]|nr:hypothetical protein AURDEDRAFT_183631 [Auricularia subglabra TFB-10046 SS5]